MIFIRSNKSFAIILLAAFISLLSQELIWVNPAFAQTSAASLLRQGIRQYESAEFESAIETLKLSIQKNLKEKDDIIQAYKYLAFSFAAAGDEQQAKLTYLKLLELYPLFDLLLSESPRLRKPLKQAKKEFVPKDTAPPTLEFSSPTSVAENTAIKLSANVTDISGVASVILFYKKSSDKIFSQLSMKNSGGDTYSATIPANKVTAEGLALYIQASDNVNNPPASKGSEKTPLLINVNRADRESPKIAHAPVNQAKANEQVRLLARVTDNVGVAQVEICYRTQGKTSYQSGQMKKKSGNLYEFELRADAAGIEYYLEASDVSGNEPSRWKSPDHPQLIKVEQSEPEVIAAETAKKGSKKLLWIGLGTVAIGGGVIAAVLMGGEKETETTPEDARLPGPPSGP
ncbi:hypothetical protein JXJ21_19490 [candidate division KSB1 bacterium]|nr:hypothetical protein [candidate division KSB1 bacterium]